MNNTETEFKYRVHPWEMTPGEFSQRSIAAFGPPLTTLTVSGRDEYSTHEATGQNLRHRYNDSSSELTLKQRRTETSTAQRTEIDVQLAPGQLTNVRALTAAMGFKPDFAIYKTCFIAWYPQFNLTYYIVYDTACVEQMRLVEIEADKSLPDPEQLQVIEVAEATLSQYLPGIISPSQRSSLSLYEMFTLCR